VAATTTIEWVRSPDGTPGRTWNPFRGIAPYRWYCERISLGCDFCYASRLNARFTGGMEYPPVMAGDTPRPSHLDPTALELPVRWRRPSMIFVCSMSDLFGPWNRYEDIADVFDLMRAYGARHHIYLVLTKRPNEMAQFLERYQWASKLERFFPHVWLGVTVESAAYAWRSAALSAIPIHEDAVRFLSAEPLLEPIHHRLTWRGIHWVIAGGESAGPTDRSMVSPCAGTLCAQDHWGSGLVHPYDKTTHTLSLCSVCGCPGYVPKVWAKAAVLALRDTARALPDPANFFFKQWGGPHPGSGGHAIDGVRWLAFPPQREAHFAQWSAKGERVLPA
jgi:protein gp37